ncbi:MAG: hypothetical protein KF883_03320 [Thermomicrobiales bacterium]|nr:hypothetical protein [Thermomicrobiales bacterium]
MVLPKMGASYVIKKFADEVMAEPKAAVESAMATALDPNAASAQTGAKAPAPSNQPIADAWDGQEITNEDGDVIGTARRVRQVGLYVISDGFGDLGSELESLVLDDESRRFFVHDDKGRVAGLIYAPHPDKMPVRAEAFRADDI